MLLKWKCILTNWINCHFNESDNLEPCVTLESLHSIISRLRENLNLDESKSSILEAHTVEEFVREKYPDFKFESGLVEASSEEELCVVASLLLYFVCVNSKDVDMKNAMCSKLSLEDQEVILKFSKNLMECTPITYKDVQTAISEACGQALAMSEPQSTHSKVSETPPALRSLHGEVRRLQAALDAERFDRNYLQEELARTNLRVEKLSLEKEQYKQEIGNLKAKISMCCGQESDSRAGDTDAEGTAKLMRQLQQAEERLEDTQGLLDDAHYERDIYKAKVDELKQERDKLVTFSQQETARVSQLSEELETERRHVHSLKELVVELRQHHQLNRCDSSQLECDDLDSSLYSLQHNSSICSEACANVVEVQLGEERAKLVLLNQQIQALQEQLNDLTHRSNTEKQNLETIISERDNDVFNLKHRINEEIDEKNYLTIQYSDEVSKLNNEMNELEQKFKDNNNQSRLVIETKMQEIQTLQEEKLSLLQSLNDETIKLENIIKNVKSELDSEKKSKAKIKEDYENHIMKLNEKVLNRNNELVELQNNVFDKSEKIESLHMELRKEKQTREEIVTKLRTEFEQMNERRMEVEHKLQQKCEEVETLLDRLNASHSYVQELRQEIDLLKGSLSDSSDNCRILEETKVKLLNDVQICNNIIEETKAKMIEEIRNRDEKIQELYKEMKNIKNGFCVEKNTLVKDYNEKINALSKNIDETRNELSCQKASYTAVIESRDRDIQTLQQENQSLNNELNDVKLQLDLKVHSLKEKLTDSENLTEKLKQTYECQIENLNVMVTKLGNYLKDKTFELDSIRREKERLLLVVAENNEVIKSLEEELKLHKLNQEKLVSEFDSERLVLKNMVTVTESVMEDQKMALNNVISEHIKENEALKEELKALKNILESERKDAEVKDLENNTLVENTYKELHEIRKEKENLIKEFENERETLVSQIKDIQYEMNFEKSQILALQINNKELEENLQKSKDNLSSIEEHNKELKIKKDTQEAEFANKVDKISKELDEQIEENKKLKNVIEEQNKTSIELREEVKSLNNQLEMLIQAKNILEQEKLEIEKEIEEFKAKLVLEITEANKEISRLKEDNFKSTNKVNENKLVIKSLEDETKSQKQNQEKLIHEFEIERQMLKKTVTVAKSVLEDQKVSLHKVITEHSKANQRLKEENKSLRQAMKIEEKTMEKNIQEKNALLELVNKELSELSSEKKILQEDSETEKQALISNIELLRNDINSKCSLIETLEVANKKLTDELQRCRNDIMLLEVNNNETKADKDSLQTELLNKVEKVSKDFNEQLEINKKLNNKLDETYKLNYLIEEKVKYQQTEIELLTKQEVELTNKINSLSNELNEQENINKVLKAELQTKSALLMKTEECVKALNKEIESLTLTNQKLEQDVNECRTKVEELMIELNRNSVELNKQIPKLQEDNLKLTNTVEEYKIVIQSLQDALTLQKQDLIQKNNFIEVEKEVLANKVAAAESALEEQKLNTKAIRSEYSREKETLTEQITKIQEDSKKIRDALNEEIKVAESKIKEKETMLLTINEEVSKLKEDNIKLLKTVAQDKIVIQSLQDTLTSEKEDLLKQINDLQSEKEVLINNVASAEAELEKQKLSAENIESVYIKEKEFLYKQLMELEKESKKIKDTVNQEIKIAECKIKEKDTLLITMNEENNKLKDDNLKLTDTVKENKIVMLSLQDSLTSEKQDIVKQISELQSEKEELVNKVKSAELALEQEKLNTENIESEYLKEKQILTGQMNELKKEGEKLKVAVNDDIKRFECRIKEKETMLETLVRELSEVRREKEDIIKDLESEKKYLSKENDSLKNERKLKLSQIDALECQNKELTIVLQKCQADAVTLQENCGELKIQKDSRETELLNKLENISKELTEHVNVNKHIKAKLEQKEKLIQTLDEKVKALNNQVEVLTKAYNRLEQEKNECKTKLKQITSELDTDALKLNEQVEQLKEDNIKLANVVEEKTLVIQNLEQAITQEKALNNEIQTRNKSEKLNLNNKCSILQEYQIKAEKQLEEREKDMVTLQEELKTLKSVVDVCEHDLCEKNGLIEEKNAVINTMNKELVEEKAAKEKIQIELEAKAAVFDLRQKLESAKTDEALKALRNEEWVRAVVQRETISLPGSERIGSHHKNSSPVEKDYRDFQHQVDNTTSDLTHSSMESFKTISDLEKIIHDKNRTITALQSDITYLKSLIADSENNLLDMTKELEISKENCHQLSVQLKKIVHQKNEEIADLKKQVIKMSAMESKATQIIRVSAKYQAIILKRIAEIKSNTILKELTNFGNTSNGDNDLRRSLNTGAVTMEDLENFLETTDKHLRRCSEKQIALQKERDRLTEVNRINESEIINLKKFLTELSVSFKTFNSVKDLYSQKLSRVLSIQRTVRREVLNLDGRIDDATMCKLERGYAAVMQDLTECVMNMERWMERCISRTTSPEKIKQAFTSNEERVSLASTSFQNTSLEVQFEELEKSFQKLLEDIVRAQKGEGARDAQAVTVMEVRAEYEDKLNRMKAKMKQLYQEQITVFKDKQKEEIAMLERELLKTREKLAESSKAYEEHIRALTTELWSVGEKFLTKKDEVDWLRKKQKSGSLMSLQHVHSSGLVQRQEEPPRPSDSCSLRSLPVHNNNIKRERRGLHMSDEEGEVFDNRWLQELAATPRGRVSSVLPSTPGGPGRISELKWRNSLCPPHLKSSYPAETQFAPVLDEEDIKCIGATGSIGGRNQRKEVGITAYKKPGPPTPSKQAGRLSATDSELRESMRMEPEAQPSRKTSTPSRLRSLFRSNKTETTEGTPRSRRLSIFRKK